MRREQSIPWQLRPHSAAEAAAETACTSLATGRERRKNSSNEIMQTNNGKKADKQAGTRNITASKEKEINKFLFLLVRFFFFFSF